MTLYPFNYNISNLAWQCAQKEIVDNIFINGQIFKIKDVVGFIGEKNNILYIAFQGSANFKDALADINIWKYNLGNGIKIHEGFYEQFLQVKDFIFDRCKEHSQIIFTGQSKGSAIASLAAYFLKMQYINTKDINVVAFAMPKCGNTKFVNSFNSLDISTVSFRYKNDIVPRVPYLFFGYKYLSKPIEFGTYKWYEYLYYPITKLLGNPLDHAPINYYDFKK